MTFDEFYTTYNGKSVEFSDVSNPFQCMDLAGKWCENLGIPYEAIRNGNYGYAKDAWYLADTLTRQYFDLIPNSPTNKPLKGDLVIFGTVVGIAGHIAIETGLSSSLHAVTFDENWDTTHYYHIDAQGRHIPYSRQVTHYYYNGVIGWLHPKTVTPVITEHQVLLNIRGIVDSSDGGDNKVFRVKEELVKVGL